MHKCVLSLLPIDDQQWSLLCNPQQISLSASAIVIDTKIGAGAEKEICNGKKREMQVATAAVARVGSYGE